MTKPKQDRASQHAERILATLDTLDEGFQAEVRAALLDRLASERLSQMPSSARMLEELTQLVAQVDRLKQALDGKFEAIVEQVVERAAPQIERKVLDQIPARGGFSRRDMRID